MLCKRYVSDKLIELCDWIWEKVIVKNNCGWGKIFYLVSIYGEGKYG